MMILRNRPAYACAPMTDNFDRIFSGFFAPVLAPGAYAAERTSAHSAAAPALNAWQDEQAVYIEAELPGLAPEKLDIAMQGDTLTIRGEREAPELQNVQFIRRERRAGSFEGTLRIGVAVDANRIKAEYQAGVLLITLPKSPDAVARKIRVNAG